jgi:Glycosyl transferases group 1
LLVPPRDPRQLADSILRLATDRELRRRLGEAARRRVEQRFTLDACISRYEKLYRAMSESNPRPVAEILADDSGGIRRGDTLPASAHAG